MKPRACMLITDINTMISRSETRQPLVIPVSFCWIFEKSMYGPLKYMHFAVELVGLQDNDQGNSPTAAIKEPRGSFLNMWAPLPTFCRASLAKLLMPGSIALLWSEFRERFS